ncbi:MAG: N-formylglutamate amidohydrolase, partial [Chloroflexi bacterium]|nr:N-formylglutamate amidohydrolase [Chloroflexota bacterium]
TALSDAERLREEDPFTSIWTSVVNTRLNPSRSRFEVDLNRPRDKAVYQVPEDAWGMNLWKSDLPDSVVTDSLAQYDRFYAEMRRILTAAEKRHGRFVVLDLHTYNHHRLGPDAPFDDPQANPEVNVGTANMNRELWGPLVDRFNADAAAFDFLGRKLDVRENVKFGGGYLSKWVSENFPNSGCCLAIEFKKFFMDEWTGRPYDDQLHAITRVVEATLPGLRESLQALT